MQEQEFDRYAEHYAAGIKDPLKRLAGADAEVFIGRCYIYEHNPLNPVTRLVVSRTAIDADAVLLNQWEVARDLRRHGFRVQLGHGLMYFPPRWRWSWRCERFIRWLPFGGQYVVAGEKP